MKNVVGWRDAAIDGSDCPSVLLKKVERELSHASILLEEMQKLIIYTVFFFYLKEKNDADFTFVCKPKERLGQCVKFNSV